MYSNFGLCALFVLAMHVLLICASQSCSFSLTLSGSFMHKLYQHIPVWFELWKYVMMHIMSICAFFSMSIHSVFICALQSFYILFTHTFISGHISIFWCIYNTLQLILRVMFGFIGGNEYGQCAEEPEQKGETKVLRRDIVIPQRCAPHLRVRQVNTINVVTVSVSPAFFKKKEVNKRTQRSLTDEFLR